MSTHLHRSIDQPIREGLGWNELWLGPDRGLIWCWERGRQIRVEEPELAARADAGELVVLAWKGGIDRKDGGKAKSGAKRLGTLQYLATWQGLRAQDLDIMLEDKRLIVCSRAGLTVAFSAESIRSA